MSTNRYAPTRIGSGVPKKIRDYVAKHPTVFEEVRDETESSTSPYWGDLRPGWATADEGTHSISAETVEDFLREAREVVVCDCKGCWERAAKS